MSSAAAQAHLAKAAEFLAAAKGNRQERWMNATASNAVSSGINAKDAICMALTGRTAKSDNHADAVHELRRSGPKGAELATTLSKLLKLKPKAQYQRDSVSAKEADKAIEWAQRLHDGAKNVVTS